MNPNSRASRPERDRVVDSILNEPNEPALGDSDIDPVRKDLVRKYLRRARTDVRGMKQRTANGDHVQQLNKADELISAALDIVGKIGTMTDDEVVAQTLALQRRDNAFNELTTH